MLSALVITYGPPCKSTSVQQMACSSLIQSRGNAVLRNAAEQTPAVTDEEDLFFARAVLQTLAAAPAGGDAGAAQTRKQKARSGCHYFMHVLRNRNALSQSHLRS